MQIGDSSQYSSATTGMNTPAASAPGSQPVKAGKQPGDVASTAAVSPSQDDAVQISPQGLAAASTSVSASPADAGAGDAGADGTTDGTANGATGTTDGLDADSNPVKSLAYGALGLQSPDAPPDPNQAYTVGRWIAAAATILGLFSLFL